MKLIEKALVALLALAILISIYSMGIKIFTEGGNRGFEISMSYREIETLARITGQSTEDILSTFKAAGMTALVIEDTTVRDEANWGRALILNGWQLLDHERFLGVEGGPLKEILTSKDFNPTSYYVLTKDQEAFQKLESFLPARGFDIKTYANGMYVVQEVRGEGYFSDISLGFDPKAFELAHHYDLDTILFARDLSRKSPEEIKLLSETFLDHNILAFIPQDNKLPNHSEARSILTDNLKHHSIILGFDEFAGVADIDETVKKMGYSAVRVYNRPPHKFMEEYLLAVRDRNDRVLYLHPFLSGQEDLVQYNAAHISEIRDLITSRDIGESFKLGGAKPFEPYATGNLCSVMAALGTLWALWKLAHTAGAGETISLLVLATTLAAFGGLAFIDFSLFRDAAGLLAAVVFPVMGIFWEMKRYHPAASGDFRQIFKEASLNFVRVSLITAMGAIILGGIYGDIDALLGIEKFRGIKALYISAYAIIMFLYLLDLGGGLSLRKPVLSLGGILAIAALSGALFVLITRSGNDSMIPIPRWELTLRTRLENLFWVRPRTKEFLIGFPALMLAGGLKKLGYYKGAQWSYLLALSGTLSMMNTFSHFHIATLISVVRSLEGILLGMALGALALGGVYLYEKRGKDNA